MTARDTGTVVRLHEPRVLLVGRDRRFLRVASVLLARRGCSVTISGNPETLLEEVGRRRADVVVMDGSDSLRAAARAMAALEAREPPVEVIVVYDDGDAGPLHELRVVPKWGAFDRLADAVVARYDRLPAEGGARHGA